MPVSKRTTLSDIARRAETSTMAVSVVLNGARSNTRVSDATRRRITEIAATLNYSPNAMAQGLKRQRTQTIGVHFSWAGTHTIHNLYSAAVLDGIVDGAAGAGYHVLLYTVPWVSALESSVHFSDRRTDGVIVVAPGEKSDVVAGLASLGLPVTVLSSVSTVPYVPYIAIDNAAGARLALDHLHGLGHTRIAFAGLGQWRTSMRERHETYITWLAEQGLPLVAEYVLADLSAGNSPQNASKFEEMLSLPDRPTALFCVTDDLATEALDAVRNVGLSVPEDVSVVGFDDILLASLTVPKLTTVRLPLLKMGQQAARLLIKVIEGKRDRTNEDCITTPELIVRGSTTTAPTVIKRISHNDRGHTFQSQKGSDNDLRQEPH
ncbi:MAG: LacI family DNA-binding transcriptional regulator [Armatimonadota bacterium]